jgi:hypothetical protein
MDRLSERIVDLESELRRLNADAYSAITSARRKVAMLKHERDSRDACHLALR